MAKKTETAIATTTPTAMQQRSSQPAEGLEGIEQSDLIIPRLRVMQPTSAEAAAGECSPGVFLSNLSGATYEKINMVPLAVRKGRVMFVMGGDSSGPECCSDDNVVPAARVLAPKSRHCDICAEGQWKDRTPPACQLVYSVYALNLDEELPFVLQCKGTALKSAKRLLSWFALRNLSPFAVQCVLSTSKNKNDRGTYYVPEFTDIKLVEPADKYRQAWLGVRGYDIGRTMEAEVAANQAPVSAEDTRLPSPGEAVDDLPF